MTVDGQFTSLDRKVDTLAKLVDLFITNEFVHYKAYVEDNYRSFRRKLNFTLVFLALLIAGGAILITIDVSVLNLVLTHLTKAGG